MTSPRLSWIAATALLGMAGEAWWTAAARAVTPVRGAALAAGALVLLAALVQHARLRRGGGAAGSGAAGTRARVALAVAAGAVFWLAVLDGVLARTRIGPLDLGFGASLFAAHAAWLARAAAAQRRCAQIAIFGACLVGGQHLVAASFPVHEYVPVPDDPQGGEYVMLGPDGRLRGRPDFRGRYEHPEFPGVRVELNALGLRDEACDTAAPEHGELLVVALGDSMFYGTGVSLPDTFQAHIQRRGAEITPRGVRVVCGAVPGTGPVQYRNILARLARRMQPDVVVVGLFEENDFQDTWSARALEAERARGAPPQITAEVALPVAVGGPARRLERFFGTALQPEFWTGWDQGLVSNRRWLRACLARLGLRVRTSANLFLDMALQTELPEQACRMRDSVYEELDRLRDDCRRLGAELVVMALPGMVQADPDRFAEFLSMQPASARAGLSRTAFHDAFVAELRRRGYRVVDTMERMVSELQAGRPPFFLEGHWNAHGHEVAADELVHVLGELAR